MPICRSVVFKGPHRIEIREEPLPTLKANQALVKSICSAISSGSEMLIYRGQFPKELVENQDPISTDLNYPLAYGYANVGRVVDIGKSVNGEWMGRLVFAFQPHATYFVENPDGLLAVPEGLSPEIACFLPFAETAVNLVQDGAPILGERVVVFGQGVVGLLTAAILAEFPLSALLTSDCYPLRRTTSLAISGSVTDSLDPFRADFRSRAVQLLEAGADLVFELSGNPSALNDAISLTRFNGRIVIGSWYGEKNTPIDLGGSFHRSRIRLISSQVSTIAPELSARWDKPRRFQLAWNLLRKIEPQKWITHKFTIDRAEQAYKLLDELPEQAIQLVFVHD